MGKNRQAVWQALCILEDYFSRMGGSARYEGMNNMEIPLYVGCELVNRFDKTLITKELVRKRFLTAASSVINQVQDYISSICIEGHELADLIIEYVDFVNLRTKPNDHYSEWAQFVEIVEKIKHTL